MELSPDDIRTSATTVLSRRLVACLLVGVAALAFWWARGSGPIDLRWDGGAYYLLGTSLERGDGYRVLSEPGNLPSSLHPPLVPAIVALHQFVLRTADPVVVGQALRFTLGFCSAAYAMAVFLLLSASLPLALSVAVTLVAILQPQYIYFSDCLYAEGLFALLTVLFFVVRQWRRDALGFVLCAVCAVLAYEARTAGIALLAAWVVDYALRKEYRRALAALAVSAVVVTSWNGWIKAVESSPDYRQPRVRLSNGGLDLLQRQLCTQPADVLRSLVSRARTADAERLRPPRDGEPRGPTAERRPGGQRLVDAAKARDSARRTRFGGLFLLARREYTLVIYVALSFAAICATPFQTQFVRYLLPLFPFLALGMFRFLAWVPARVRLLWPAFPQALVAAVPWAVLAVVAPRATIEALELYVRYHQQVSYIQHGRPISYRLFYYGPESVDFDAALDWLDGRAAPDDVLAAGDPQWAYLRIGRRTVLPPFELDGRKGQRLIDSVPVKYLVESTDLRSYRRFTTQLLAANPQAWRQVWSGPNGVVVIHERVGTPRP